MKKRKDVSAMVAPVLVDEREAARYLGVCSRTLWGLRHAGNVPHLRIGDAVRYRLSDLDRWIDSRITQ